MGHGSQPMFKAKLCNRRINMLVETVPVSSTFRIASGRVSITMRCSKASKGASLNALS
jgi:hypothetical protein